MLPQTTQIINHGKEHKRMNTGAIIGILIAVGTVVKEVLDDENNNS